MLVNLNTGSKQASYLRIKISLELADAATQPQIQAMMPRVLDSFQTYLRELRHEDLSGSAGTYRDRRQHHHSHRHQDRGDHHVDD
ncbi:MAG: hypothetical protein FJX61_14775 [Alphaproteobacteria bacterium]|nr:hypothetical protein [Alphaproteobacteria bacterium]